MAASESPTRDWPHDPDGEEGSEGGRKYGLAVLAKKVDEDEFPVTREAFLAEYAEDPVRVNHRTVVSVADVFEYVEEAEFESKLAFHRAVGDAMRRGDFWEYVPAGVDGA